VQRDEILTRYRVHSARFESVAARRKPTIAEVIPLQPHAGLEQEPTAREIEVLQLISDGLVNREIGVRLYKGSARVVTRSSPNAVYDAQLATFAESGGLFSQNASPGFIELWTLQSRMAHRVRSGDDG